MDNIYTASYRCKSKESVGMPGYYNVVLGLPMSNGAGDIKIGATCARFEVGKEYIICVSEM